MTKNLDQADKVYHELLQHVLKLIKEDVSIEMVAASLMSIAQRLYKTHLSPADYNRIMKVALETYVEPYDLTKGTLH
tara:strand:- start:389 stop:619 length:231 start_codon:yes stop_codon:yes gene_type:complete